MKQDIPYLIIYLRMITAFYLPILAAHFGSKCIPLFCVIILLTFLGDILDGVIARSTGTSTALLRKLDSVADRLFWLAVAGSIFIIHGEKSLPVLIPIGFLVLTDSFVFLISLWRFKQIPSAHNLLTKLWGIFLAISLTQLLIDPHINTFFQIMFALGILSRIDTALIYLILPKWECDVKSTWHALAIRKGKMIRQTRWLN